MCTFTYTKLAFFNSFKIIQMCFCHQNSKITTELQHTVDILSKMRWNCVPLELFTVRYKLGVKGTGLLFRLIQPNTIVSFTVVTSTISQKTQHTIGNLMCRLKQVYCASQCHILATNNQLRILRLQTDITFFVILPQDVLGRTLKSSY